MSITDVTARIAQIQSQLAVLAPAGGGAVTTTQFADVLDGVTTATSASGDITPSGDAVVTEARRYLGLPYVWGSTDPSKGLDCSGLVQLVYKNLGIDLPRVSADQARQGTKVDSLAQARPGDLLAWDNSSRNNGADHIAIYVGNGKMIEAPRTGLNVRIVDVPSTPDYIRRIVPAESAAPAARVSTVGSAAVDTSTPYANLFASAARKYGVSAALLSAVAKQESGYDPKAVSPAGAQGLMQLMPATARGLGVANAFDPAQAVDGAARMLRDLTARFGRTDLALAAYNAGPGAVLKYDGIPPYPETQRYVRNVLATMRGAS
jgi:soluble lytic murein transglycosylase-like protein